MGACLPDFRFGALLPQEGERWTVTLGGYMDDQAPLNDAGFLESARDLQKPEMFNVIRNAEPLIPPARHGHSSASSTGLNTQEWFQGTRPPKNEDDVQAA